MKNHYIYIFIGILFFINFVGCKKKNEIREPELAGYFYIYHIGEENHPVSYFIVKTNGDTTYRQITKYWKDMSPLTIEYNIMEMREKNIEDCSVTSYSKFKNIISEYHKNNTIEPNYKSGTFEIYLTDNIDTLHFIIGSNEYAKLLFKNLEQIAQENGLEKASNRFKEYKNMQP